MFVVMFHLFCFVVNNMNISSCYVSIGGPKRNFLRRTKATAPPETTEPDTATVDSLGTTTAKDTRRGGSSFRNRNQIDKDVAKNASSANETEKRTRPSFTGARRNERPQATRSFARRRPGGASTVSSSTPQTPSGVSTTARQRFNFGPRRRPPPSSTTTTTTSTTTAQPTTLSEDPVDIEESLQNIGDTDAIEDPSLEAQEPKKTNKIQRRPLVALKDASDDQNPSATNDEESKRQSKKFSASINQNQLDDLLKLNTKDQETTTEFRTSVEEFNAKTALAIAAHQLVTAPLPNTPTVAEETKPVTQTTQSFKYTSPQYNEFTDGKTPTYTQEEYPSTPTFRSTGIADFVQTTSGDTYSVSQFESPKISPTSFEISNPTDTVSTQNFGETYAGIPTGDAPDISSTAFNVPNISLTTAKVSYPTTNYDSPRISSTNFDLNKPTSPNTFAITESKGYPQTDYETSIYESPKSTTSFVTTDSRQLQYSTIANTYQETSDYTLKNTKFTTAPTELTSPTYITSRRRYTTPTSNTITQEYFETTRDNTPTGFTSRLSTTFGTESTGFNGRTRQRVTTTDEPAVFTGRTRQRFTTTDEPTGFTGRSRQRLTTTDEPTVFTGRSRQRITTTDEATGFTSRTRQTFAPTDETTGYTGRPRQRTTTTDESASFTTRTRQRVTTTDNPSGFTGRSRQRATTTTEPTAFTGTSPTIDSSTSSLRSTKYVTAPVEEYGFSTSGYSVSSQEPSVFTREYLLESPVTKTYDEEYQYLSPISSSRAPPRKVFRKKIQRRVSSTRATPPRVTSPVTTVKPFEKVTSEPVKTFRPIVNYDYYDDSEEKFVEKYVQGSKVILHDEGTIECLDVGNFPHPTSCKKFMSCARMESGSLVGWEYICPKGLSFDPVGGICNWSAGLGCEEKDA